MNTVGNKEKNMTILNITNAENNADVLSALSGDEPVNVRTAMQIPMVSRCVNMIAGAVAMLPIKLYRRTGDGVEEIKEDRRLDILNRDTGDTICADYMRYAWVRDLLLTGAAYAYIERRGTDFLPYRLYYVASEEISRDVNRTDPIKKIYRYNIGGRTAEPWEMLKILRNTDGYGGGKGILEENPEMIATAYGLIKYQKKQVSSGGAKRGILRTNGLKKDVVEEIKEKWAALWGAKNDRDTMFILNSKDSDFKELSSTSVDMQLNQTQETIDKELMKLFGTNDGMLTEETVKNAVLPVIDIIEAALDTDLLYEREKRDCYFAFDTRELTRGDINQRYNAYATALSQNFMQLDEVRELEDLPPLGINFVKLGLNDVLLDPKTGQIYTPNTNAYAQMGKNVQVPLTDEGESGTIEARQEIHGEDGRIIDNVPDNMSFPVNTNAEERRSELSQKIETGELPLKIRPQKQNTHRKGTAQYKEGNSYVTVSDSVLQNEVDRKATTGTIYTVGNHIREVVKCDQEIGVNVDKEKNTKESTNRMTIHYSKKGTHCVPAHKEGKK